MSDWRLVVPIVDRTMAQAMIDTIDPHLHGRVVIVDNGGAVFRGRAVQVYRYAHNLGVAGSWNLGVRVARVQGATHVMLASSSTRFGERAGRDLDGLVDIMEREQAVALLPPPTHWHTAMFRLDFFERVGPVDEWFYPAYYEECDLERRALLLGVDIVDNGQVPDACLDATTVRDGHGVDVLREAHPGQTTINYDALADYWHAKWGCHVDDRRNLDVGHKRPFGRDDVDARWCPPVPPIPQLHAAYGIVGR